MTAIISLVFVVLLIVALWKVFTKAGKPGWHSLIPILNIWDLGNIAWNSKMAAIYIGLSVVFGALSGATAGSESNGALTAISGIVSIGFLAFEVMMMHKLSKSFGHGIGFTLGLIFLSPIFFMILGFGSSQYIGPEGNGAAVNTPPQA